MIRIWNKYIAMNFLELQFLDIFHSLGRAPILDNLLKVYIASEENGFFTHEWFDCGEKLNVTQLPPIDSFWSKLKNQNLRGLEYVKFTQLKNSGMEEETISKKMRKSSTKHQKTCREMQSIWEREGMQTFRDIFRRYYKNQNVEPTFDAMRKLIGFYHSKRVDMLTLEFNRPNLANRLLHSSPDFLPNLGNGKKNYYNYKRKWLSGGTSIVFTRYAKVGETKQRSESPKTSAIL